MPILQRKSVNVNRVLYFKLSTLLFLQFVIWGSWYVTLGTYLLETLHFNGRQVGFVYGATAIAAVVSPLFTCLLADRKYHIEHLLVGLHLAGGLVMLATSWLQSFHWFYPSLIAYSLLYIPTFALSNALVFHHLPDSVNDFPKVRVWGTVGWVLASLFVGLMTWEAEVYPMYLSGGSSLLLAVFSLSLPATPPQPVEQRLPNQAIWQVLRQRPLPVLIVSLVLISIPTGYYYSFLHPFLHELGMVNAAGKMSLGQVSEVVFMLVLPYCLARFPFRWIIAVGLAAWGVRYVLFAYGDMDDGLWMLYVGILLHGIAFNFAFLAAQIYVDKIVPTAMRATAHGLIAQITLGIGALVGAFAAGETVRYFSYIDGYDWMSIWLVPGVFGLVVTVGFLGLFREK